MLDIIDSINESLLAVSHVLVSFDMVSMFPNIDSKSGLKSVKDVLLDNNFNALEICLICNDAKLIHQSFLQKDGVAQGPHMCCFYANIALAKITL